MFFDFQWTFKKELQNLSFLWNSEEPNPIHKFLYIVCVHNIICLKNTLNCYIKTVTCKQARASIFVVISNISQAQTHFRASYIVWWDLLKKSMQIINFTESHKCARCHFCKFEFGMQVEVTKCTFSLIILIFRHSDQLIILATYN